MVLEKLVPPVAGTSWPMYHCSVAERTHTPNSPLDRFWLLVQLTLRELPDG